MLKKTGNIILALLVLCSTTGLIVNQHFSNGELYATSLYADAESCCDDNSETTNTCHEETKVYKVKDYFHTSNPVTIQVNYQAILHKTNFTELFNAYKPVTFFAYTEYNLLKLKIPNPELLQVFIL